MKNTIHTKKTPKVPASLSWLFPYKKKGMSISTNSAVKYYIFQNRISLTIINWLAQGMRGMGKADMVGKIILEILFFVFFLVCLKDYIEYHALVALFFAHTLNWLVNAHFWDIGRFIGITSTSPARFFPYLRKLEKRLNHDSAPPAVLVIGGLTRKKGFTASSDVDMIFIRGTGFKNIVKSVMVTIRERAIAFFCKFPLHLELYDTMESMNKHRDDEVPVIVKDTAQMAEDWYRKAGREISSLNDYDSDS